MMGRGKEESKVNAKAFVLVWPQSSQDGSGHVAIEIDGKYYSITPTLPSAGFFGLLPLPAAKATFEEDCLSHGRHWTNSEGDEIGREPIGPTHRIPLNDELFNLKKMQARAEGIFSNPGTAYQLVPRFPSRVLMGAGLSGTSLRLLSEDPFSGVTDPSALSMLVGVSSAIGSIRPFNCVTLVADIMSVGYTGVPTSASHAVLHPSHFYGEFPSVFGTNVEGAFSAAKSATPFYNAASPSACSAVSDGPKCLVSDEFPRCS